MKCTLMGTACALFIVFTTITIMNGMSEIDARKKQILAFLGELKKSDTFYFNEEKLSCQTVLFALSKETEEKLEQWYEFWNNKKNENNTHHAFYDILKTIYENLLTKNCYTLLKILKDKKKLPDKIFNIIDTDDKLYIKISQKITGVNSNINYLSDLCKLLFSPKDDKKLNEILEQVSPKCIALIYKKVLSNKLLEIINALQSDLKNGDYERIKEKNTFKKLKQHILTNIKIDIIPNILEFLIFQKITTEEDTTHTSGKTEIILTPQDVIRIDLCAVIENFLEEEIKLQKKLLTKSSSFPQLTKQETHINDNTKSLPTTPIKSIINKKFNVYGNDDSDSESTTSSIFGELDLNE